MFFLNLFYVGISKRYQIVRTRSKIKVLYKIKDIKDIMKYKRYEK